MNRPTVSVKNNASHAIFVSGDPNWDDQILLVNGEPIDRPYPLTPGSSIKVSVDWDEDGAQLMLGVIFADGQNYDSGDVGFYQLSIGQEPKTGILDVTDGDTAGAKPHVRYTLRDQKPWSMLMDFVNA